jgi:hypothetical protein
MKAQTRMASLRESAMNIVVGFGIQWVANYFVLPLFGLHPSIADLFGLGAIFTVISVVRSYVLRRVFEKKRAADVPPDFQPIIEELAIERHRQISGEGYGLDHDDFHTGGEIAAAAAAYTYAAFKPQSQFISHMWPWAWGSFKPTHARRNLIKAGAMIIAEIGRIDRARRRR